MGEYYYSLLNSREKNCYCSIVKAIKKEAATIGPVPFISSETMAKVINSVNYDHPEFFYVDFQRLNYVTTAVGIIYHITYSIKSSFRSKVRNDVEQKVKMIIDRMASECNGNDFEKYRWIHNYLVKNVEYNQEAVKSPDAYLDSFSIKGVFIDRVAVCEGISKAFKYLCDKLGIDAIIASGISSLDGMGKNVPHAWNIVKIENEYCHIDVTWDIGVSEASKYTRFDYFCLSDKCISKDHVYSGLPTCKSDNYTFFKKRRRWFKDSKHLDTFIETELKKNTSILYFKIENDVIDPDRLQSKIYNQVKKILLANSSEAFYIEMVPNKEQLCFFFRIKQEGE